jgi:uncharacterized protein (TIGR02466 family)
MEIIENKIFYSTVYLSSIPEIDNKELLNEIYLIKSQDNGKVMSNFGGWQSSFYNGDSISKYKQIKGLVDVIESSVKEIFKIWGIEKDNVLKNIWFNVNSSGNFNLPHTHPGTLFSGTYYVDCDDNSGKIVFLRQDAQEHYLPHTYNEYTHKTYSFLPKPKDVVFFPSYMGHYVEPNQSKIKRVSVAFDF